RQRLPTLATTMGSRTHLRLAWPMSPPRERLRTIDRKRRRLAPHCSSQASYPTPRQRLRNRLTFRAGLSGGRVAAVSKEGPRLGACRHPWRRAPFGRAPQDEVGDQKSNASLRAFSSALTVASGSGNGVPGSRNLFTIG